MKAMIIFLVFFLAFAGYGYLHERLTPDAPEPRPQSAFSPGNTPTSTYTATSTATLTPTPMVTATPPCPTQRVIWDQMSSTGTGATASQDFEMSLDSFDAFAEDDFQVGSGEVVVVNKLVVRGKFFNGSGPVESF